MSVQQRAALRHQSEITGETGDGGRIQWLVDAEIGAEHVMAYRLTLDPGAAESHIHFATEEVAYVLEGSGEIGIGRMTHRVSPGVAVYIPDATPHRFSNTGATPLVLVGAMAPPIELDEIHPAPPLPPPRPPGSTIDESGVTPTMMDEERVTPTTMGERSFRVLVSPEIGCRSMTQFTGIIPTGRAPLHAHPHEEAVYVLAGTGRLWIEGNPVGELRPGSVVFFPIGVRHTLENVGAEDMKVLGAFSPAGSPEAKLPPGR